MTKGIQTYTPLTDQQSQNYLAGHLPKGKLFARKYDPTSNLYSLLYCVADFIKQISIQFYQIVYNMFISQTDILLTDWETSVGIPQNIPRIVQGNMTYAQWITARQNAVMQLISKIPVYNINSAAYQASPYYNVKTTYENYVYNLTGIKIQITFNMTSGTNRFPMQFPIQFGAPYWQTYSTYIINIHCGSISYTNSFPMQFPILFAALNNTALTIDPAVQQLLTIVLNQILPTYICFQFQAIP